jgi:molybdenum cofactor cytidylyltransferase
MISGIVLAAGTSSRLGRPKQLLDLGGAPVLRRVVDVTLATSLDEVIVVLGHQADRVEAAVPSSERVRSIVNPDFLRGQSSSLRAGLLAAAPRSEAAVILLGDQPGVRSDAVDAVIGAWREAGTPLVQASYGGRPAHPTLLARELWPRLQELSGDEGARAFIARHLELRTLVEVEGELPEDIDTEGDYQRALSRLAGPG